MNEAPRLDVPATGEDLEESLECMRRILRRPRCPRSTVAVPRVLDRADLAPVDFASLDRACLPEGTFQICLAIVGLLQAHVQATHLEGPTESRLWVFEDGRIVATAARSNGEQVRALEERWIRD